MAEGRRAQQLRTGRSCASNPALLQWAFGLTRELKLPENDQMRALAARYKGYPAAQQPPRVLVGANLAAETFWHGAKMDEWAHRWVRYIDERAGKLRLNRDE